MDNKIGIKETYKGKLWEVTAEFNEQVAHKALMIRDALMAARQLIATDMITGLHHDVVGMVMRAAQNVDVEYCIKYIRHDNDLQHKRLLNDALEIAILESNFTDTYPVTFAGAALEIPPDFFDDSTENEQRAKRFLPTLPQRMGFHPDEQRSALIRILKIQDPLFHQWFNHIFDRAATTFAKLIQQEVIASYAGKSKSGMAGNSAMVTKPTSDRRVRRSTKRVELVSTPDARLGNDGESAATPSTPATP